MRGGEHDESRASSKASRSRPITGSAASASSSTATFDDVSPIDEEPIAEVARGGAGEVDAAVAAARAATETWGSMPPKERAEVLHRIADGVEARVPELAAVETRDNGSLLRSMQNSVMPRVARNFRFFADQLLALETGVKDYDGFAERRGLGSERASRP